MAEKEKPQPDIVKVAARVLKTKKATPEESQRMAARIMDDEKNDPKPNRLATPSKAAELKRRLDDLEKSTGAAKPSPKPTAPPKPKPPTKKG